MALTSPPDDATLSRRAEARATARELLELLEGGSPVEACLMKALRLARLLRDSDAQGWLQLEAAGYSEGFRISSLGSCERYARMGRITADNRYFLPSMAEYEAIAKGEELGLTSSDIPGVLPSAANYIVAGATQQVLSGIETTRRARLSRYQHNRKVLSALRAAVHAYATDSLIALEFSDAALSIMDAVRAEVDVFVRANCPRAAEKLVSMNDRLQDGDTEALTGALTSCRRLLETVADAVFPARSEPIVDRNGKPRKVGQEAYKNRLLAFLEGRITSASSRSIASSELEHLAARLDAVYEKACKGVHDDVTIEEARLAVMYTYLFVAEVARHAKDSMPAASG